MQTSTSSPENVTKRASRSSSRRAFLGLGTVAALAALVQIRRQTGVVQAREKAPRDIQIVQFTAAGERERVVTVKTILKTDAEWKEQLSPAAFDVARHAGTERPFSGPYESMHDKGIFSCVCCDTALFNAATKFESGTGWPSFWQPIARENVHETGDMSLGMSRTAVSCRRCDAHLGHVFDDGPRPTGLRYCMNAVALKFLKAA